MQNTDSEQRPQGLQQPASPLAFSLVIGFIAGSITGNLPGGLSTGEGFFSGVVISLLGIYGSALVISYMRMQEGQERAAEQVRGEREKDGELRAARNEKIAVIYLVSMATLCVIGIVVLNAVRPPAYIATNAVLILASIASAAVGAVAGTLATRQHAQSTRGKDVLKMKPPPVAVPRAREEHQVNRPQFDWPPTRRQAVWILRIAAVFALLTAFILIGYRYGITLWDWIKLLIVPAVIAGGGLWFNAQQRAREQYVEKEREQAEALQTYLEQISQLLVDRERPLHKAQPGDSLSTVARATTLNVLLRLDGERKRSVLLFVAEANLIGKSRPTIPLGGADLREALLHYADLSNTNLSGIDLSGASLFFANLYQTDISYADLSRANLNFAQMFGANLYKTDLSYADLSGAMLMEANLSNTHLNNANLSNVIVSGANLRGVDLTGALGMSNHELEEQAASLEGAIMPNGQMYEDWLKSRGDDGENLIYP